ncbi:MAG: hypothetical protein L0H59_12360 [Tomitella sp.]|nr:hypothetical protein [Tomitella sp.]
MSGIAAALATLPQACLYGDDSLPQSEWERIYPCPVTACWLHLDLAGDPGNRWCGQGSCCNPLHRAP